MKEFVNSFLTIWIFVGLFMILICLGTIVIALTLGLSYSVRVFFEIVVIGCVVPLIMITLFNWRK